MEQDRSREAAAIAAQSQQYHHGALLLIACNGTGEAVEIRGQACGRTEADMPCPEVGGAVGRPQSTDLPS